MIALENHKADLVSFFKSQPLAVLATHNHGQPYGSLVAFAASQDLNHLVFSTTRSTRKFANLSADPRVAMVIDNRSNHPSDLRFARAVTAAGRAQEISKDAPEDFLAVYLDKHPHMEDFVSSPSCALVAIRVEVYYLVTRFQNVVEIHLT
ncbi:Pyridoxamine 5'-phosphate oxidase-related FMN-binding protein [uncultured Desulfatiglans sp.]|uniref:Pyridoxamine 5'-phosphate oxidase-related FMN-binding protein n=1 Tax=Uncultured Desulfatiglans sp. TaxID=1748965 RepID=A0A653AA18_UNCDX|nr:Pyridoxamine 5'-phosphate oxidase-related FMN-binding protein [uncultured Desulfatiglans sp.]